MLDFFEKNGLILSEVFLYMERSKNLEKNISKPCKKEFAFLRRSDRKNTLFEIPRNLIRKACFK